MRLLYRSDLIQISEFVAQGDKEKEFWQTILQQIPDLADGDVLLFQESANREVMPVTQGFPAFGEVNYFPLALPYFIDMPKEWRSPPRLFGLWPECEFEDAGGGRKLHTPPWGPGIWPVIRDGGFIFFRLRNDRLVRSDEPVDIQGKIFRPKALKSAAHTSLKASKLFQNIFGGADSSRWFTIRDARNYPR